MDSCPDLYPLTSLQIGDIKSYLSRAFLYFVPTSHKFLILVDNQSWWKSNHSKTKRLRELMIAKCRVSPFKNTKALRRWPSLAYQSSSHEKKKMFNWLPNVSMASVSERAPFSMMNLYKALHGFLVFEVAWKDVRGINYLNELQTDTSLALEVKLLRKWEFNSIGQAMSCISLWFSSTRTEAQALWSILIFLCYKAPFPSSLGITVASKDLRFNVSQAEVFSEDVFFDVRECPIETNDKFCMDNQVEVLRQGKRKENLREDANFEPMEYKDTFLLLGFNDRNLPFKLNQIITSDLKLLTLLEAGLPSWVIFLQSYPFFNKVYRPWMRPLLRILYAVISSITVIIGFYDLYKNVPLLKAAVSHLSWPFKWIEACDMISRIRYLGTMMFLHIFEKGVRLFLMKTQAMKLLLLLLTRLTRLLVHPLEHLVGLMVPIWSTFTEIGDKSCMIAGVVVQPLSDGLLVLADVLLSPLELLYSFILHLGTFISCLLDIIWELLVIPSQGCLHLAKYVSSILVNIYNLLARAFVIFTNSKGLAFRVVQVKPSSSDMSFWHSVWNDLFSKVFRSLKNIICVLVTFFTSCNRHRLSIYNYFRAALQQRYHLFRLAQLQYNCRSVPQLESHHKVAIKKH